MDNDLRLMSISFLFLQKIRSDFLGGFIFAIMTPAWRHDQVKQFVFEAWGLFHISPEIINLSKVGVPEIIRIYFPGNTIFNRDIPILHLICSKYPIPNPNEIAKIGIHIQRIPGMMNAVVRRSEYEMIQKSETRIFEEVFSNMDESPPGAVDEHNKKQ